MATASTTHRWPNSTDLVGIDLLLQPQKPLRLNDRYMVGVHAWFLQQIARVDTEVATYLHDAETDKAFTLSQLHCDAQVIQPAAPLNPHQTYRLSIHVLQRDVVRVIAKWLKNLPKRLTIDDGTFQIIDNQISLPPLSYNLLWKQSRQNSMRRVSLQFVSPTAFRVDRRYLTVPLPRNLVQSYLRRWNSFAGQDYDVKSYLDWIEQVLTLTEYRLETQRSTPAKSGVIDGCVGYATYQLAAKALHDPEAVQLFHALMQLAPYCGTGVKTAFGLGMTQSLAHKPRRQRMVIPKSKPQSSSASTNPTTDKDRSTTSRKAADREVSIEIEQPITLITIADMQAPRLQELTQLFLSQRKRQGGQRAINAAERDAEIILRSEQGESVNEIAAAMGQKPSSVKTYLKRARQQMRLAESE